MEYHVNIMQCMQPNFLLTVQVYPMFMSSVPHAWGMILCLGHDMILWHDIVFIELLYCVTNFELVWT